MWKIFVKAGEPGWVVAIIVYIAFAQAFGKGVGFALGLLFLGVIFFPILAWGDSRYSAVPQAVTA